MIEGCINLGGCLFKVQRSGDWTAIFTEATPCGMRPTRFILDRTRHTIWQFHFVDAWGDSVSAHKIAMAYYWVCNNIGDDFAQSPLEIVPRKHAWDFDEDRKMTFCKECGVDMSDESRMKSCDKQTAGIPA